MLEKMNKNFYKKLRNHNAFSIVETMVSLALLAGISAVFMMITNNSEKNIVRFDSQVEIVNMVRRINTILSDDRNCRATFEETVDAVGVINIAPNSLKAKSGNEFVSVLQKVNENGEEVTHGNAKLVVTNFDLKKMPFSTNPEPCVKIDQNFVCEASLNVSFKKKKMLIKSANDTTEFSRDVPLYMEFSEEMGGDLIKCHSLGVQDIWTQGSGKQIYYSGGNVGIAFNPSDSSSCEHFHTDNTECRQELEKRMLIVDGGAYLPPRIEVTEGKRNFFSDGLFFNKKTQQHFPENPNQSSFLKDHHLKADFYAYVSDRNAKKNIKNLESPLEKLLSLKGVSFTWKDSGRKSVGFIAQEVQKVLPEIVEEKNKFLSVDYGKMIPLILDSIRLQQLELNKLKKELEEFSQ